jgi:hypothetical protein
MVLCGWHEIQIWKNDANYSNLDNYAFDANYSNLDNYAFDATYSNLEEFSRGLPIKKNAKKRYQNEYASRDQEELVTD